MSNNIKTLNNYILNRKCCPKCFKNNFRGYFSPGKVYKNKNTIQYRSVQIFAINKNSYNHKCRFYRGRYDSVQSISNSAYDLIEVVCTNCYTEQHVYLGHSIEK